MYKCEQCSKEFKSATGLKRHKSYCKQQEPEVVEEVKNDMETKEELSDNIVRKINKLLDARKSTWDAKARHEIDIEIARLKNGS